MSDLFSTETQRGIDHAEGGSDPIWVAHADAAIVHLCKQRLIWTSDDVWERLDKLGIPRPCEKSELGPRILAAKAAGLCKADGAWVPSRQPQNHREIKVWRSL